MKLSVAQLRNIIKEEVSTMLAEGLKTLETIEDKDRQEIIKAINSLLNTSATPELIIDYLNQYKTDLNYRGDPAFVAKDANLMPRGYARPAADMSRLHSMGGQAGAIFEDE